MAVIKISDNKTLPAVVKITAGGVSTISKVKTTQAVY